MLIEAEHSAAGLATILVTVGKTFKTMLPAKYTWSLASSETREGDGITDFVNRYHTEGGKSVQIGERDGFGISSSVF